HARIQPSLQTGPDAQVLPGPHAGPDGRAQPTRKPAPHDRLHARIQPRCHLRSDPPLPASSSPSLAVVSTYPPAAIDPHGTSKYHARCIRGSSSPGGWGQRLRALRLKEGMTQQELAGLMGRQGKGNHYVVGGLERGTFGNPTLGLVADYLRACRASVADMAGLLEAYTSKPTVIKQRGCKRVRSLAEKLPPEVWDAAPGSTTCALRAWAALAPAVVVLAGICRVAGCGPATAERIPMERSFAEECLGRISEHGCPGFRGNSHHDEPPDGEQARLLPTHTKQQGARWAPERQETGPDAPAALG
ncbi:helix-turn-helix transcriptional regulator, partial [candidate division WOR-3 bacterium]|nr:helix-turn-helix transcriptional regulator [candidate division WOR-3 bacterium]